MEEIDRIFMVCVVVQYTSELLAFGYRRSKRKEFVFETITCLYILVFYLSKSRLDNINTGSTRNRVLNGIAIFFQIFHYLKRNSPLT